MIGTPLKVFGITKLASTVFHAISLKRFKLKLALERRFSVLSPKVAILECGMGQFVHGWG
jgi:hypothetical protein